MLQAYAVQLRFDKPDVTYEVGDKVTGTVYLTPRLDLAPDRLRLELFWRTHGRGDRTGGKPRHYNLALPRRYLKPGYTYEVPFRFTAPTGPLTYRGRLLKVKWHVRVVLDLPGLPSIFDPKAKAELHLLPKAGVPVSLGPYYRPPKGSVSHRNSVAWTWVLFGLSFIGVGLYTFFGSFVEALGLFPLAFMLSGTLCTFIGFRNALAMRRLGRITLSLGPRELSPDRILHCEVGFTPRTEVQLEHIRLVLKAQEKVIVGNFNRPSTYRHTVFEEVRERLAQHTLSEGERVHITEQFRVPNGRPYTFLAAKNEVTWKVVVQINMKGMLGWQHEASLVVHPWLGMEDTTS